MLAIHKLTQLALERKKELYPNVPHYALIKPKFSDKDANSLTKCILEYFRLNGGYAVRINTQGQYNEKLGRWTKGTTKRGTADVHACLNGMHYSIEIKIGKDTLSEHQEETQSQVTAAGGNYFVAKDFQSFYDWILRGKEGQNE